MNVGGLPNLKEVTFPKTLRKIPDRMFINNKSIESVIIPDGVTEIGKEAFAGSGLKSITIADSVTKIGPSAFKYCGRLTAVTLPAGLKMIEEEAFYGCPNLATVEIQPGVTEIGESAFYGSGITSIVIPEGVTVIGSSAFRGCKNLVSVTIPDSCLKIGWRHSYNEWWIGDRPFTFYECFNLVTVNISTAKRSWSDDRGSMVHFENCSKLNLASQAALRAAGYTGEF
jgi:hypothetical protein